MQRYTLTNFPTPRREVVKEEEGGLEEGCASSNDVNARSWPKLYFRFSMKINVENIFDGKAEHLLIS